MPCIVYQDEERAVLVFKGSTILQASIDNKIPHYSECGGKGTCTTCKVKVLSGYENLMVRNQQEMKIARERNWDKTIRLACQARVLGDIVIEKLIKDEEECFKTYLEPYYQTPIVQKDLSFLALKILNFDDIIANNPPAAAEQKLEQILTTVRNIGVLNGGYVVEFQPRFVLIAFGLYHENFTNEENAVRAGLLIKTQLRKIIEIYKKDESLQNLNYGIAIHSSQLNVISIPKYRSILLEGRGLHEIYFFFKVFKHFERSILLSRESYEKLNLNGNLQCKKFKAHSKTSPSKTFFVLQENCLQDELYLIFSSHLEIRAKKNEFLNEIFQTIFTKKPFLEEKISGDREKLKVQVFHLMEEVIFGLTRYSIVEDMLKELGARFKLIGFHESEISDLKEIFYESIKKFLSSNWNKDLDLAWKNLLEKINRAIIIGFHRDL